MDMPYLYSRTYKTYKQAVNFAFLLYTTLKADPIWQMQNKRHLQTVNRDKVALELFYYLINQYL